MNALEIAKQLLKNLQDKPEGTEEIKKHFTQKQQPAAAAPKGFQKAMLDEDFGEAFAKRKKPAKKAELGKMDPVADAVAKKPLHAAAPAAAPAPAPAAPSAGSKFKAKFAKPKMTLKAENPDKEEDAKLGEQVERDVEQHMRANKDAERKEGHKPFDKSMLKEEYGFDKKC